MEKKKKTTLPKEQKDLTTSAEPVETKTVVEPEVIDLSESKTTIDKNVNTEPKLQEEEPKKPCCGLFGSKKHSDLPKDVLETKHFAWLAYIFFFIPLLINRTSPFVRHHANEGLEINIFDAIAALLLILGSAIESNVAWIHLLMIIFTVIGTGLLVLTIVTKVYMIITTLQGKSSTTPWMWDLRIIK